MPQASSKRKERTSVSVSSFLSFQNYTFMSCAMMYASYLQESARVDTGEY